MDNPVVIEVEGRVNVIEKSPGNDIAPSQRNHAQARKVNDILIVLECSAEALEQSIGEHMTANLGTSEPFVFSQDDLTITFEETTPIIRATLTQPNENPFPLPPPQMAEKLSLALHDEITAVINAKASQSGRWEARVSVNPIKQSKPVRKASASNYSVSEILKWLMLCLITIGAAALIYTYKP